MIPGVKAFNRLAALTPKPHAFPHMEKVGAVGASIKHQAVAQPAPKSQPLNPVKHMESMLKLAGKLN